MRGIANGELGSNGESLHLSVVLRDCCPEPVLIQRRLFIAIVIMPAGDGDHRHARKGLRDPRAPRHRTVETDQHNADRRSMSFDDGIGGKRRGNGNERDSSSLNLAQLCKRLSHRFADADGKIAAGGERLGRRRHPVVGDRNHRRVGVGAAGVDAEKIAFAVRVHAGGEEETLRAIALSVPSHATPPFG
jgi:hypothetical protein